MVNIYSHMFKKIWFVFKMLFDGQYTVQLVRKSEYLIESLFDWEFILQNLFDGWHKVPLVQKL